MRGGGGKSSGNDSLEKRDKLADSITISFRYLDTTRNFKLDSSINDFTKRFPIPATHLYLGNDGTATKSYLFSPNMKAGWDYGFHSFDVYKLKMENVRFFNTTRPYTELNYLIGSRAEQIIEVLHTQNIRPNWNASINYRGLSSQGFFQNQKSAQNNYLVTSWYQSKSRRYNNYAVILANGVNAGESGGFEDPSIDYLNDPQYKERFSIPTKIGPNEAYSSNTFGSKISTGNVYRETTMLMRQQYDFGKKDSLVTDSTVVPLFYPRLRFEHTFSYGTKRFEFRDYTADSTYYASYYDIVLSKPLDSLTIKDEWKEIVNDFSIYQFPDAKNLQQFIKLGATVQNLRGNFNPGLTHLYNLVAHGEYRNRTRNQKWDIEANGKLYFGGENAGDYEAHISLQTFAGRKLGSLQLGFENVNRSPSSIYNIRSNFYLDTNLTKNFNKENTSHFFGSYYNPAIKLRLGADYYLVSNYMYLTGYYTLNQESSLFNFLQLSLQKIIKVGKHWYWYADLYLQQKAGDVDINVPLFFTRNRFAYEGVFFKNLNLSTGVELRYHTAYKADGYSPVLGQFFYQDSITIKNRPDIRLFLNFRIRGFKVYISAANLNSASISNGFGFRKNNIPAPEYAYPGLQIRVGIFWSFVN